jgi:hypothetical protein
MLGIPTEIVILSGGLGNQMFQYSFFLAKKEYNKNIALTDYLFYFEPSSPHNGCELFTLFNVAICKSIFIRNITWLIRKLLIFQNKKRFCKISSLIVLLFKKIKINIIIEKNNGNIDYDIIQKLTGLCLYIGYWQSEKYFLSVKQEVLDSFSFERLAKSCKTSEILKLIENTNSISIHVRRGDFLMEEEKFGGICTLLYYEKAISEIEKQVESPVFFIFSDDMKWVRENILIPNPHYIDWNQGKDSWQDMYLMSKCKHNIIANSTFSWWGAWLNQSPQKVVITPSRFLNNIDTPDLIPNTWITV